jgi:RNA polymerase sigma factor (sigma-70 family)
MTRGKTPLKIVDCSGNEQKCSGVSELDDKDNKEVIHKKFADYLFQQHQESIIRYLMKCNCSKEDAEDILHETYIRLINANNLEQMENRAKSYIFTVAINIWRDKKRSEHTRRKYGIAQFGSPEVVASFPGPESYAQFSQDLSVVKNCLLGVGARQRKVFLLRAIENLTFVEIARILSVSIKTTQRDYMSTIKLCKKKLREKESEQ